MNILRIFALLSFAALMALTAGCSKSPAASQAQAAASNVDYYTCTMHPSVHEKDPGKCPICSMDLVPVLKKGAVAQATTSQGSTEFSVPVDRQQQIGVTYATVDARPLVRTIRAVGSVESDQKRTWSFVARTDGYVQQLFVTSPGELVEKGTDLLSIYSPDLLTAERELILLGHASDKSNDLLAAARSRLRQWNVSDDQIAALEKSGQPSETLILQSPFRGVVERVMVEQGASVKTGDALARVADLSSVWVWADVYETELAYLQPGQKVAITATAFPNRKFAGVIASIDPSVDPIKRTARARLDVPNPDLALRPGMFVDASFTVDGGTQLAVPVEAIMPTGTHNYAFLDHGEGRLEPRLVDLGAKFGDYYEVRAGLAAGDRVVKSANFLIDAESKVQGALQDFGSDSEASPESTPSTDPAALSKFVQTYLELHNLLADDKFDGLAAHAATLRTEAEAMPQEKSLLETVDAFHPASLQEARIGFGKISAALLESLKKSPVPRQLYVMRCPMWNSSPSEWVQVSREVQNPFLGQAMATCGEAVRTLQQ